MSDAQPYMGSKVSLITAKELRFEGVLAAIDTETQTLKLENVVCYGTEDRPTQTPVPPQRQVYEVVTFSASNLKDLTVLEQAAPPSLASLDPAILSLEGAAPAPAPVAAPTRPVQRAAAPVAAPAAAPVAAPRQQQASRPRTAAAPAEHAQPRQPAKPTSWAGVASGDAPAPRAGGSGSGRGGSTAAAGPQASGGFASRSGRPTTAPVAPVAPAHAAHAGQQSRGGRGGAAGRGGYPGGGRGGAQGGHGGHGGHGGGAHAGSGADPAAKPGTGASLAGLREVGHDTVYKASKKPDYDLEAANARFEEARAALLQNSAAPTTETEDEDGGVEIKPLLAEAAYNKSSSFFDNLSSGQGGMGRAEDRQLNRDTFGAVALSHRGGHGYRGGYHRGGNRGGYQRGGYRGGYGGGQRQDSQ